MTLKNRLRSDTKDAMRSGDTELRDTLRMILAAIKQEEIDEQTELDDSGVERILAKQAKQRRETIADAEKADRPDLAAEAERELALIQRYLPKMLTAEEIKTVATDVINETGASGMQEMGKVMGQLMPRFKGRADGKLVSDIVRQLLQN